MLDKLKTELQRYPLQAFLALAIAAPFVFGALTTIRSRVPFVEERMEHVGGLTASLVGLAAVVCCWALSEPGGRPRPLAPVSPSPPR